MDALRIMRGDRVLLRYQVMEESRPKDITGRRFRLRVRDSRGLRFEPVTGVVEDARRGRIFFVLTETDEPMRGIFEIAMFHRGGRAEILTPPGGVGIEITEKEERAA
jgi:hypothetical protein